MRACIIEKRNKNKHEQTTDMNKTNKVRHTKKKEEKKRTNKRDMTIVFIFTSKTIFWIFKHSH